MMPVGSARPQHHVLERVGVHPAPPAPGSKVGIARNVRQAGLWPINGLRHPPTEDTNGWYIWAGDELSDSPGFFAPLHVEHVAEWRDGITPYLALPPGWRFQIAPDHEDVWFDESLLAV